MARNIDQDLQAIQEAVYGEEVRGAIIDGIRQAYSDAKAARDEIGDLKSALVQTYNVVAGDTNLLTFTTQSKTTNGITFAESSNGTVTANGTSTANAIYGIQFTPVVTGLYHLSGCPSGGGTSKYYQRIKDVTGNDTGSGVNVSLVGGTTYIVWCIIAQSTTVSDLQFTPVLVCNNKSINDVSDKVGEVTHEIVYENTGEKETFLLYSNFDHYGLNTDGTFISTQPYRVSCTNRITVDVDTIVYVANGFRWGYIPYVNGAYSSWIGWKTAPFTIPAGTEFVVQIARQTENTNEVADVIEFTSAVTFYKKIALKDREQSLLIDSVIASLNNDGVNIYETTLTNGTPSNPGNTVCVSTDYIPISFGQKVQFVSDREVDTGYAYAYGIYGYDSSKTKIVEVSPTSRIGQTSEYTVTNNSVKYIRYAIAQIGENNSTASLRVASFNNCFYRVIVAEDVDFPYDIDYFGKPINTKLGKFYISSSWISPPSPASVNASATQGFAIYGGVVFQLYSGSTPHMATIDYETGAVISTMEANVAHGNSMQFLNEFYDASDEFPMAIIADGLSNEAFKVRVTRTSITVLETYAFDITKCGYYVSTAVDDLNGIVYTIGYTNNSYNTDDGTNRMIIAAWDIKRTTTENDKTIPMFIESFTVPFMDTIQGPTFFNGLFFVFSSPGTAGNPTKLFAIDPGAKRIVNRFDYFNSTIENNECESLYFYNHNDGKVRCYVKCGTSTLAYYIMDFNT